MEVAIFKNKKHNNYTTPINLHFKMIFKKNMQIKQLITDNSHIHANKLSTNITSNN